MHGARHVIVAVYRGTGLVALLRVGASAVRSCGRRAGRPTQTPACAHPDGRRAPRRAQATRMRLPRRTARSRPPTPTSCAAPRTARWPLRLTAPPFAQRAHSGSGTSPSTSVLRTDASSAGAAMRGRVGRPPDMGVPVSMPAYNHMRATHMAHHAQAGSKCGAAAHTCALALTTRASKPSVTRELIQNVQAGPPKGAMPTWARAAPGRVCFWELVDEGLVAELAAHAGCVTSLAMHPAGACLLTASVDGCVKVWV